MFYICKNLTYNIGGKHRKCALKGEKNNGQNERDS